MFGNPTDPYSAKNGLCSLENDSQLCNDKTTVVFTTRNTQETFKKGADPRTRC